MDGWAGDKGLTHRKPAIGKERVECGFEGRRTEVADAHNISRAEGIKKSGKNMQNREQRKN